MGHPPASRTSPTATPSPSPPQRATRQPATPRPPQPQPVTPAMGHLSTGRSSPTATPARHPRNGSPVNRPQFADLNPSPSPPQGVTCQTAAARRPQPQPVAPARGHPPDGRSSPTATPARQPQARSTRSPTSPTPSTTAAPSHPLQLNRPQRRPAHDPPHRTHQIGAPRAISGTKCADTAHDTPQRRDPARDSTATAADKRRQGEQGGWLSRMARPAGRGDRCLGLTGYGWGSRTPSPDNRPPSPLRRRTPHLERYPLNWGVAPWNFERATPHSKGHPLS